MTETCIFCRLVAKESPAQVEYEDDEVIAFLQDRCMESQP